MQNLPSFDDANLILRLYEQRREERLREARAWFAKSFKIKSIEEFAALCPPGSNEETNFRMVYSYWEMVASFVTSGVLHAELFYQSGMELLFVWERIRDFVPEWRKRFSAPQTVQNIEAVAGGLIEYLNAKDPGAYAAFSQRVRA